MGSGTESIFVEGHSRDDTYTAIEREAAAHPSTSSLLLRQTALAKRMWYASALRKPRATS